MQMDLYFFHFRWTWATKTPFCPCSTALAACLRRNCWVLLPPPQPASKLDSILVLHRLTKSPSLTSFLSTGPTSGPMWRFKLCFIQKDQIIKKKKNKPVCGCCYICCANLTLSEFPPISSLKYVASGGRLWKTGHNGCILQSYLPFNLIYNVIFIELPVVSDVKNTRTNCGRLQGKVWLQRVQLLVSLLTEGWTLCPFPLRLRLCFFIVSLSVWFSASWELTCP